MTVPEPTMPLSLDTEPVTERACSQCGRVYRRIVSTPCDCPPDQPCIERDLFGHHADSDGKDVDEAMSWRCPHGVEYAWSCRGCGHDLGGWGVGAAGFGELCGGENEITAS